VAGREGDVFSVFVEYFGVGGGAGGNRGNGDFQGGGDIDEGEVSDD